MTSEVRALRSAVLRGVRWTAAGTCADGSRPYAFGDDYRRMDWYATARTGEPYVRDGDRDESLAFAAIVDTSKSMRAGRARSLADAAEEACTLWRSAAAENRFVRLSCDGIEAAWDAAARQDAGAIVLLVSDCFGFPPPYRASQVRSAGIALLARDPWYEGIPLRGFHCIRDLESDRVRGMYFGSRERERFRDAVRRREATLRTWFSHAGWRTGILTETDGAEALFATFDLSLA